MKRILLVTLVLLAAVAAGLAALLSDNNIQRFAEAWLSAQMEREIRVEGAFHAALGNPLRVTAESVRLANPDWAENPVMATAARVEAAIDLTTIPGDQPLILTELVIERLEGELVSDEEGRANWEFGAPDDDGTANFLIRELQVTDATLEVRRPDFAPVDFEIEALRQKENPDGLLETSLAGTYNDRPVQANGLIGPFQSLLDGENVRLALSAGIGTLQIEGSGLIDSLTAPRQPRLKFDVKAPDAIEVASMFGLEVRTPSDIELRLEVAPADVGVSFQAGGRWGPTNLDLRGRARDLAGLDGIELQAAGAGNDLRGSLLLFGFSGFPAVPFKFAGDLVRDGEELDVKELDITIGSFLFELKGDMNRFPSLNDANLKLAVQGDDVERFREVFGLPGVAKGVFSLQGEVERAPSGVDEFRVRARTELGKALLAGTLGPAPDYVGTRASLRAEGENFGRFAELLGVPGLKARPFNVSADVEVLADGYRLEKGAGLDVGEAAVRFSGKLGEEPLVAGTLLDWSLTGVDVADVARIAGLQKEFPSRPLSATGQVQVRPADFVLTDVTGTIGEAEFTTSGQIGRDTDLRGTDVRLSLRGPELERLAFLVGDVNLPAGPFQLAGRLQRTGDGLRVSESAFDIAGAQGKLDGELLLPADPLRAKFDVEVSGPDVSAFWEGRYAIRFGQKPFLVDLRGELNDGLLDLEDGRVTIGATELVATGKLRPGRDTGRMRIRVTSPEISEIATFQGIEVFPGRRLDVAGVIEREGEVFRLTDFLARTSQGDLAGAVTYTPGDPARLEGALTSTLLDISWITDPVREEVLQDRPAREAEQRGDGLLIPDWELPLEWLTRLDVDLSITADEILRKRRDVRNAYLRILIDNGALTVAPWRFGGGSGSLDGEFRLTPSAAGAEVRFRFTADDLVTGLFQPDNADLTLMPRGDWDVDLRSRGRTVRELAANLSGQGKLSSAAGRLENTRGQDVLFGNTLSSIVAAVNPFVAQEPYTEITCSVFPFTFKDGVMKTAPSIVVQTDKLNILSRGQINLRNERLDLSFNSKPRGGLGISAGSVVNPFIRIGGTLAEPTVALDKTGALITGGAAFFTAGLSLIAKAAFDAAWRSPDPCGRVLEEAEKRFAKENGG